MMLRERPHDDWPNTVGVNLFESGQKRREKTVLQLQSCHLRCHRIRLIIRAAVHFRPVSISSKTAAQCL